MRSLVVVHNAESGGQHQQAELSRRKDHVAPPFDLGHRDVESRRDDTTLVDSSEQLDYDFATSVVVDDFEFSDVTFSLHEFEELDEHLRRWTEKHLPFAFFLGVENVLQSDCQYVAFHVVSPLLI